MLNFEFECSVDFPVYQFITKVELSSGRELKYFIFYDYVLNQNFNLHPFKLNRAVNSYLTEDFFDKCYERGIGYLTEGVKDNFICPRGEEIKNVKLDIKYPYISSYKFLCEIINGSIVLKCDVLNDLEVNQKNINVDKIEYNKMNIKQALKELYDVESWNQAIMHQAKMKYCYKSKYFELEDDLFLSLEYLDEEYEEIFLPKEYFNVLTEDNIMLIGNETVLPFAVAKNIFKLDDFEHEYANDLIVLKNDKLYVYQTANIFCKIELFDDYTNLPFVLKKEIIGEQKNKLVDDLLLDISKTEKIDTDLLMKLMKIKKGE